MEKGKKNHNYWKISRGGTDTISILSTGTGTQFSISDQFWYFGNKLDISYLI